MFAEESADEFTMHLRIASEFGEHRNPRGHDRSHCGEALCGYFRDEGIEVGASINYNLHFVAFSSQGHMTSMFNKNLGVTPGKYRQDVKR